MGRNNFEIFYGRHADRLLSLYLSTIGCMAQAFCPKFGTMDRSDPGTGNVLHPKTTITSIVNTLPVTFNEAVLHQKYVLEKRSLRQIAAEFASSKTAIRNALVRFGIPLNDKGSSANRVHALPFGKRCVGGVVVDHKGEQRAIGSVLKMHREGLSNCAIARVLTEMKVPTKQQGKAWHHEMVRQVLLRSKRVKDK